MTNAVVIGGGPVGLSTAILLARGGLEVILAERHPSMGGRTAPIKVGGQAFDPQPWFLAPEAYEGFFSLVDRDLSDYLDLIDLDLRFRAFYEEGPGLPAQVLDLDADAQANWSRCEALSKGGGEALSRLVVEAAGERDKVRDRLGHAPFLGALSLLRPSGLSGLPWAVRTLTGSIDGLARRTARHPSIRRLVEFPALALTGSPATTPAAYAYLSYLHLGGATRFPKGGFGSVIAALERVAREEGVDLRPSSDVARILVDPHGNLATGVVLRSGDIIPADLIVSCVDPHHTETTLLPVEFQFFPEASWERFTPSPSCLIVAVTVKRRIPELAHHNLFFPKNWDRVIADLGSDPVDDPFATEYVYVGRPTATDASAAPKGKDSLVLVAPFPANPSPGDSEGSRRALTEFAEDLLKQIETLAAIPGLVERSKILRVVTPADLQRDHSAWCGSADGLAPTRRGLLLRRPSGLSPRVRNLLHAGSPLLPDMGVPGAFAYAEVTAKILLGSTDPTPLVGPLERGFLAGSRRRDALGSLLRGSAEAVESDQVDAASG